MVHLTPGQVLKLVGHCNQQHELQLIAGEAVPLAVQTSGQGVQYSALPLVRFTLLCALP